MKIIKKNRAKINYVVDIVIGIGFLFSAVSGLVLFFAGSAGGGYQGGRNPQYLQAVLGLSRDAWKSLHNYSSIAMVVGVLGHLILHWNWMVCMTRNILKKARRGSKNGTPAPAEECGI